jgi:hypothetical protein
MGDALDILVDDRTFIESAVKNAFYVSVWDRSNW